jgi:hypothetical protein
MGALEPGELNEGLIDAKLASIYPNSLSWREGKGYDVSCHK